MSVLIDPVFIVESIMLSVVFGIGIFLSYSDVRSRRVPNKLTLIMIIVGIAGQILMAQLGVPSSSGIGFLVGVGLLVSVGMTLLGVWAPGDAKIYLGSILCLPPSLFPQVQPFSTQAVPNALLMNALLCYFLFLLSMPLWKKWNSSSESGDDGRLKGYSTMSLRVAGLLGVGLWVSMVFLDQPLGYVESIFGLFLAYRLLSVLPGTTHWPLLLLPGVSALAYLAWDSHESILYLKVWALVSLLEGLYQEVRFRFSRALVRELPASKVRAGMIVSQSILAEDGNSQEVVCKKGQAISEPEVARLRYLSREGMLLNDKGALQIREALPFAPFIVAGSAAAAFFGGDILSPLSVALGIALR